MPAAAPTPSLSPAVYPPPLPPGAVYVAAIEPSLNLVLISTVWSAFLVPVAITLFFFSSSATRRQPLFVMNFLAVLFGLAEGATGLYILTRAILARPVSPHMDTVFASMTIVVPNFAELVLLFRVLAVYPPRLLSWHHRIGIYAPIVAFKVARTTNFAVFIARWAQLNRNTVNPLLTGQQAWGLPNAKIEWFVQFFDTTYVSTLFLARLRTSTSQRESPAIISDTRSHTFPARLRTLFWIATSNFVLPVLLNLVQLIYIFRDPEYLHGTYIFIVDNYVQIIGVLLATLWSSGSQWTLDHRTRQEGAETEIQFVRGSAREQLTEEISATLHSATESVEQLQDKEPV